MGITLGSSSTLAEQIMHKKTDGTNFEIARFKPSNLPIKVYFAKVKCKQTNKTGRFLKLNYFKVTIYYPVNHQVNLVLGLGIETKMKGL